MKKRNQDGIVTLQAGSDKVLTNGSAYSSVGGAVQLGKDGSPGDWREIDKSELLSEKEEEELFD